MALELREATSVRLATVVEGQHDFASCQEVGNPELNPRRARQAMLDVHAATLVRFPMK